MLLVAKDLQSQYKRHWIDWQGNHLKKCWKVLQTRKLRPRSGRQIPGKSAET